MLPPGRKQDKLRERGTLGVLTPSRGERNNGASKKPWTVKESVNGFSEDAAGSIIISV